MHPQFWAKFQKKKKKKEFSLHYLVRLFWATHSQLGTVGAPSKKGRAVIMSFKAFVELERQGLRVEVEDVDVLVLAAGGQFEAVGGETAVPYL